MLLSSCELTSLILLVTSTKSQHDMPMIIKIVFIITISFPRHLVQ